ncbi:MAG: trypsin-like peptidase domain-containing protein [Caldilineaceae bacterium]|nr:trypsin-like peptidase domain-containing protein [Caldilineaceae bacterium]
MNELLQQFSTGMAGVGEQVLPAVVQIRNGHSSAGTGIIWRGDGLIVTNAHVVSSAATRRSVRAAELTVVLTDGRTFTPRILALEPTRDLAVLQIDAQQLPTVALGQSEHLKPGELVFAFGFPWGVAGGATTGVVIGVGAQVGDFRDTTQEWVAASLHLRPGHSGGPMVDGAGRLIGINTLMNGPDVGVAVPVDAAKQFVQSVLTKHQHQERALPPPSVSSPVVVV